jgi:hypothetical protein
MIAKFAVTTTEAGTVELDMKVLRQMAQAFDEGADSDDGFVAKLILAAYDAGYDHGVEEAERNHNQTAMLLMCTGGHA